MLVSSETFVKHYFWKYLDISINKAEYVFVKDNCPVDADVCAMVNRFAHVFDSVRDIHNYTFVLSQLRDKLLSNFIVFYNIMVLRFVEGKRSHRRVTQESPVTIKGLCDIVGNDEELFKMVLISAHYFL